MAAEATNTANRLRLTGISFVGLAIGIWDFVGEAACALSPKIGEEVLAFMKQELGLEINGQNPEDLLAEIGQLFVDEFNFASDACVESTGNTITIRIKDYAGLDLMEQLEAAGVNKPFICPIMNTGIAAIRQLGLRPHVKIEKWEAGKGMIGTFRLI